jgi:hypothetical protein
LTWLDHSAAGGLKVTLLPNAIAMRDVRRPFQPGKRPPTRGMPPALGERSHRHLPCLSVAVRRALGPPMGRSLFALP